MFTPSGSWKATRCLEYLTYSQSPSPQSWPVVRVLQIRRYQTRDSRRRVVDQTDHGSSRTYLPRPPSEKSSIQSVKTAQAIYNDRAKNRQRRAGTQDAAPTDDETDNRTHGGSFIRLGGLLSQSRIRTTMRYKARRRRPRIHAPIASLTPSEELISALSHHSSIYATPAIYRNKLDISHHDPMSIKRHGRQLARKPRDGASGYVPLFRSPGKDMKYVLAEYIRHSQNEDDLIRPLSNDTVEKVMSDEQLLQVSSDEHTTLLETHGFESTDVAIWAWILTAKSSEVAAMRLWAVSYAPNVAEPKAIPAFVFLSLLRRQDWNPRSLRVMIQYAWARFGGSMAPRGSSVHPDLAERFKPWSRRRRIHSLSHTDSDPLEINQSMLVFVRLLRHARKVYSEAILSISTLLGHHLTQRSRRGPSQPIDSPAAQRLTFLFNSALSLLAHPASMRPFHSIAYQQRAQFKLLRSMNEFEPPLAVDRDGYRAVIRVQLAHKKTMQERDWAAMKAKSWPPWKEDRSGLDTEKGLEYGISRAGQATRRQMEAGYAIEDWEDSAGILAGWDTDESPTIQTRSLMARPIMARRARRSTDIAVTPSWTNFWAARIRATRSVDEAWACFLAYKDEDRRPVQDIYYSVFEKLIFEEQRVEAARKRKTPNKSDTSEEDCEPLPGDSPMVYDKPGPSEAIYVRTSPPGTNLFFEMTLSAGIRPSGRFLAFILSHARRFQDGLRYLRESAVPPRVTYALLSPQSLGDPQTLADVGYMSDYTFAAFIQFLCWHSPVQQHRYLPVAFIDTKFLPPGQLPISTPRINTLLQAFRLVLARRPFYRPPWTSLLTALARSEVSVDTDNAANGFAHDLLAWRYMQTVLHQMSAIGLDLDFAGFRVVCGGLEKAIFAAVRAIASSDAEAQPNEALLDARQVLEEGLPFVKALFKRLVSDGAHGNLEATPDEVVRHGSLAVADMIPRLLEVPHPAHLHAFIRVLGLREDREGIQALVEWMSRFASEIQVVTDESMNGRRLLRRCLVAARVFLEQTWTSGTEDEEAEEEHGSQASRTAFDGTDVTDTQVEEMSIDEGDVVQKVYKIVQSTEEWGGWPTDQEVEAYCRRETRNR